MSQRRFSIATATNLKIPAQVQKLADCVAWLISVQNKDGTWGGNDNLDKFICTSHAAMALLAVGISSSSLLLSPSLKFLEDVDQEKNLTFFWRSGVFCNLDGYKKIVEHDADHIWKFRKRIGVHQDYPLYFFLLKLVRFSNPSLHVNFSDSDVLKLILEDWNEDECWYSNTAITSMGVGLLHDMRFKNRSSILKRSISFLCAKFHSIDTTCGSFSDKLIEDLFLIFNLYETTLLKKPEARKLRTLTNRACANIFKIIGENNYVESPPAFGGNIDNKIYPTAVAIRALLAFLSSNEKKFESLFSSALVDAAAEYGRALSTDLVALAPFWGPIELRNDPQCFVLMPFDQNLTEIYERYVKRPIQESTTLRCFRSDDIYKPHEIMRDIWHQINASELIIADMTHRNPNVFYELGLAHALGKKAVLISQNIEDVPFDLRAVRTIVYRNSPGGFEMLSERLISTIRELCPRVMKDS